MSSPVEALEELSALQAVLGPQDARIEDAALQQLVDAAASGALTEDEARESLGWTLDDGSGASQLRVVVACRPDSGAHGTDSSAPYAELHVTLPYGYPGISSTTTGANTPAPGAAAQAHAARCSVVGFGPGAVRAWADAMAGQLQVLAEAAAIEGRPCLHELVEELRTQLGQLGRQQDAQPHGTAAANTPHGCCSSPPSGAAAGNGMPSAASTSGAGSNGEEEGLQVLLLRLDHMRNRSLYTKTIGAWVKDLGLTGRLIFQGNLILILLEGEGPALKDYLVRHRTENVDVDSHGRRCRERMMDVVVQQAVQLQLTQSCAAAERGAGGGRGAGAGGGAAAARAFTDWREVTCANLEEVGRVLGAAGLAEWLRPAAGLR